MTPVTDLHPWVRAQTPGCPAPVISAAIVDAARDLCQHSWYWRERLRPMTAIATRAEYRIEPPEDAAVLALTEVLFHGSELEAVTVERLSYSRSGWRGEEGRPAAYVHEQGADTVRLVPMPDKTEIRAIQVMAALQPSQSATTLPDRLLNEHKEAIESGALYRLLRMPNVSWSNPGLAAHYGEMARSAHTNARNRALKGYGSASLRVRPRRFV